MITGGDLRQSRLDVGYKTFTISPCQFPHIARYLQTMAARDDVQRGMQKYTDFDWETSLTETQLQELITQQQTKPCDACPVD